MKQQIPVLPLCAAAIFIGMSWLIAQNPPTATSQNEGSQLVYDATNDIWRFKWWGRAGQTYFIQHSEDLLNWNWVPVVEAGDDSIKEYGFDMTGTRFFLRLKISPTLPGEPGEVDSDGDGIADLLEVQYGSDPLNYYERPGGMIVPNIQILSGDGQTGLPSEPLGSRLTVRVVDAATGEPLSNAPIVFTPSSGRVSRTFARTGTSGQVGVSYTCPDSPGFSSIMAGTGGRSVTFSITIAANSQSLPPNAPSALTTTYHPDGSRTLTWTDNSDNEDVFVIWQKNESGEWVEIGTVPANQNTATITAEGLLAP